MFSAATVVRLRCLRERRLVLPSYSLGVQGECTTARVHVPYR